MTYQDFSKMNYDELLEISDLAQIILYLEDKIKIKESNLTEDSNLIEE